MLWEWGEILIATLGSFSFTKPYCDRFLDTPPRLQSGPKRSLVNPQDFSPLRKAESLSAIFYYPIAALVAALLFVRGPAAITGFIITVLVWEAINRMLGGGPWPHVTQKQIKRLSPSLANTNASPAVILVFFSAWIFTPFNHRSPGFVLWNFAPLSSVSGANPSTLTARPDLSRPQVTGSAYRLATALALASPAHLVGSRQSPLAILHYGQLAVYVPNLVLDSPVRQTRMLFSHSSYLNYGLWSEPPDAQTSVRLASFYMV